MKRLFSRLKRKTRKRKRISFHSHRKSDDFCFEDLVVDVEDSESTKSDK